MAVYLTIIEDMDNITQSTVEPTDDEHMNIEDGVIRVFRFENGTFEELNPDGDWEPVESRG